MTDTLSIEDLDDLEHLHEAAIDGLSHLHPDTRDAFVTAAYRHWGELIAMARRVIEAESANQRLELSEAAQRDQASRAMVDRANLVEHITELEAELSRLKAPLEGSETSEEERLLWTDRVANRNNNLGVYEVLGRVFSDLDHATAQARIAGEEMRKQAAECVKHSPGVFSRGRAPAFQAIDTLHKAAERVLALPLTPTETESDG